MKIQKILFAAALCLSTTFASAQSKVSEIPSIDVRVSIDSLVTPDRFKLEITLEDNTGAGKKGIEEAENRTLIPILKKAGIDIKKDLAISSFNSNYKKKGTVATKNYSLNVNSVKTLNEITAKLTKADILVGISSAKVSNENEIKNILKVKAMKASKEQALILLTAADCSLGKLLNVSFNVQIGNTNESGSIMMAAYSKSASNDSSSSNINTYKKVNISSYMNVTYEIINK